MDNTKCPTSRALFLVCVWLTFKNDFYLNNQFFLDSHHFEKKRVSFISHHSPTVILWAYEDEIKAFKEDERCMYLEPFCNIYTEKLSEKTLKIMGADSLTGTNSRGFSGDGQVFGMISAEREIFHSDSPQLRDALDSGRINVIPYPVPPIPALHPSVVLCEIIGGSVSVGTSTFRGMADQSSVIFCTSETAIDVLYTVEFFIDIGIRIINFSAGFSSGGKYTAFDRIIDYLIEEGNLLFVTASGNRRDVTSPGIAFNVLSVGNLQTNAAPDTPSSPPFSSYCTSSSACSAFTDNENTTIVHKPDVVAPGTFMPYVTPLNTVYYNNTGTSFACPWVTGVALQLFAINPAFSYLEIKAIIALSCNRRIISSADNPTLDSEVFAKERTGFGLVSSDLAIQTALEGRVREYTGSFSETFELFRGDTLYASVCYNKSPERQDEYVNLRLAAQGVVITSDRENQNLHVVEYTAEESTSVTLTAYGSTIKFAIALLIIRKDGI